MQISLEDFFETGRRQPLKPIQSSISRTVNDLLLYRVPAEHSADLHLPEHLTGGGAILLGAIVC